MAIDHRVDHVPTVATVPVDRVASVLQVIVRRVDPVPKVEPHHASLVQTVPLAIVLLVDPAQKVAVLSVRTVMLAVQSASPQAVYTVTP